MIRVCARGVLTAVLGVLCVQAATAQGTPKTFFACYVPLTGTVYRIKELDVKQACTSTAHVPFNWVDGVDALRTTSTFQGGDLAGFIHTPTVSGLANRPLSFTAPTANDVLAWDGTTWLPRALPAGGTTSHAALSGLQNDDHPQYMLAGGSRQSLDGFASTGIMNAGSLPVSGTGTRFLWYPRKAALRAGNVSGTRWDDASIGAKSVAFGSETIASGVASTAFGEFAMATGDFATAFGYGARAHGDFATAFGDQSEAPGVSSVAMGYFAEASHLGSFVFGDRSINSTFVSASTDNQFVVRAQHFWFGTNSAVSNPAGHFITTSTGAFLSTGGAWTNASDVGLKHAFADLNAEDVLQRIAGLPIRAWSYKSESASVRHVGPTAQDFRKAFGLGQAATSIATVDADGISLLGIQALEARSRRQDRENQQLRARLEQLEAALAELQQRIGKK